MKIRIEKEFRSQCESMQIEDVIDDVLSVTETDGKLVFLKNNGATIGVNKENLTHIEILN